MNQQASTPLRVAYCLVVFGATVPIGLAKIGWVSLATVGMIGMLPILALLAWMLLGAYRIYQVAFVPGTLSYPAVSGFSAVLRWVGKCGIYFGMIVTILSWIGNPLMRALMTSRSDSGAEFFIAGVYLALLAGIGTLGLFLFEFGRMIAFERDSRNRVSPGPDQSTANEPEPTPSGPTPEQIRAEQVRLENRRLGRRLRYQP